MLEDLECYQLPLALTISVKKQSKLDRSYDPAVFAWSFQLMRHQYAALKVWA